MENKDKQQARKEAYEPIMSVYNESKRDGKEPISKFHSESKKEPYEPIGAVNNGR